MIYFFIGQPSAGKTTLGKKLHRFLKTEKRNWRQNVFHLDDDEFKKLFKTDNQSEHGIRTDIETSHGVIEYLHNNGCDVVASFISPYMDLREKLKSKYGDDFTEIYVHTTEKRDGDPFKVDNYERPEINFIDVDTTKDSPDASFSKLINHLDNTGKL